MPAACDRHCQVPGSCQDKEEYGKYKIRSKDKAVDEKKYGSLAIKLTIVCG